MVYFLDRRTLCVHPEGFHLEVALGPIEEVALFRSDDASLNDMRRVHLVLAFRPLLVGRHSLIELAGLSRRIGPLNHHGNTVLIVRLLSS